jgi:hypothetical protein
MAAIDATVVVTKVAAIAKIEAVGKSFMGLIELLYGSVRDTASTLDRIHCRSTLPAQSPGDKLSGNFVSLDNSQQNCWQQFCWLL